MFWSNYNFIVKTTNIYLMKLPNAEFESTYEVLIFVKQIKCDRQAVSKYQHKGFFLGMRESPQWRILKFLFLFMDVEIRKNVMIPSYLNI